MAIKPDPYLVGDKWTLDVDADDEVNYVANVTKWLTDNSTSTASFEIIPVGVTVMEKGLPQGDRSGLLPAKLKLTAADSTPKSATFRTTTADGQRFDKTMYFNPVQN